MKKILSKIFGVAALAMIATSFMACPHPTTTTGAEDLFEDAEIIEELADTGTSWGTAIAVPLSYAKRLQVGSKVIFTLEPKLTTGDDGNETTYLKFHVDNGNWASVGVSKYYDASGSEIEVSEDTNNAGVFNSGTLEAGTYYFVVTESNLNQLKAGFGLNGNLIVKKIGITNLAEPAAPASDVTYNGLEKTFTATGASYDDANTVIILKYDRSAKGKAEGISLSDVDLAISVNDDAVTTPTSLDFVLDPYNGFEGTVAGDNGMFAADDQNEYKIKIYLGKKIEIGDVVKVQLKSAKPADKDEDATDETAYGITIALADIAPESSYWNPLVGEEDNFQQLVAAE